MFELIELPYSYDALAPAMSADTLKTHHGKHHLAYVKKTNSILEERGEKPSSLEEVVVRAAKEENKTLFNQSGQVWNHGFFWHSMTPRQQAAPQGDLAKAIEAAFGSHQAFRDEFLKKGAAQFASGWVWLNADAQGALTLTTTGNADTPIAHGGTPILTCDVWEHAYYLDHKNDRPSFLETFFDKLANWEFAAEQYEAARAGRGPWKYPPPK